MTAETAATSAQPRPAGKTGGGEAVIRYEQVCKRFGPKVVLEDLDLTVKRGETLAIMGPSGIGKSVTLRHAIGLLPRDTGLAMAGTWLR
jgi:ABC-type transporter Mla maintaining outer membrane lipid asymmetry ATPase subunit MlaF